MWKIVIFLFLFAFQAQSQERDSMTVYYFLAEDCPICQYYSPTFQEYFKAFNSDSLSFVGLFPNRYSSVKNIEKFKEKYKIPFELKKEFFQTKTKLFGATITPEVVVYNETEEKIIYQGRIDNSYYKLGRRRRVITETELENVLRAIVENKLVEKKYEKPIGCFISLNTP